MKKVYIVGATGRSGSSVAAFLATKSVPLVLIARREDAVRALAESLSKHTTAEIFVGDTIESICEEVSKANAPIVIANFIGPFSKSASQLVLASPAMSHYVDIANDCNSFQDIFNLQDRAFKEGRCLVVGAGFGVVASEATVLKACLDNTNTPLRVRTDTIPFVEDSEPVGPTIAATIVEKFHETGKIYCDGKLKNTTLGSHILELTLPGQAIKVKTGDAPLGDLEAAKRISGAPNVIAASSAVPMSSFNPILMPVLRALVAVPPIKRFIINKAATMKFPPSPFSQSYSHAKVEWADGSMKEVWLKLGDGTEFTNRVCSEVAYRLASGDSKPGTFTPCQLYGINLALNAGGEFL